MTYADRITAALRSIQLGDLAGYNALLGLIEEARRDL